MNNQEYKAKKRECWDAFNREHPHSGIITEMAFNFAFDRAYALGREKETISSESIGKASEEYAINVNDKRLSAYPDSFRPQLSPEYDMTDLVDAFAAGVNFALGKQAGAGTVSFKWSSIYVIGDKVHVIKSGKEGIIGAVSLKSGYYVDFGDGFGEWCKEADLTSDIATQGVSEVKRTLSENLSEQKPAEPKFKLKDRVVRKSTIRTIVGINSVSDETGTSYYYMTEDSHGNNRIEFVESDLELYTDPDTSHEMPVCENHSDDTSQKEVNVNSNRNLSQNIVNCDKQLDNILKDSFRNERRLNIAAMIEPSLIANPDLWKQYRGYGQSHAFAKLSLEFADALIAECEKGGLQ